MLLFTLIPLASTFYNSLFENYRSGLLWNLFMKAPEVKAGLEKLGFYYEN